MTSRTFWHKFCCVSLRPLSSGRFHFHDKALPFPFQNNNTNDDDDDNNNTS